MKSTQDYDTARGKRKRTCDSNVEFLSNSQNTLNSNSVYKLTEFLYLNSDKYREAFNNRTFKEVSKPDEQEWDKSGAFSDFVDWLSGIYVMSSIIRIFDVIVDDDGNENENNNSIIVNLPPDYSFNLLCKRLTVLKSKLAATCPLTRLTNFEFLQTLKISTYMQKLLMNVEPKLLVELLFNSVLIQEIRRDKNKNNFILHIICGNLPRRTKIRQNELGNRMVYYNNFTELHKDKFKKKSIWRNPMMFQRKKKMESTNGNHHRGCIFSFFSYLSQRYSAHHCSIANLRFRFTKNTKKIQLLFQCGRSEMLRKFLLIFIEEFKISNEDYNYFFPPSIIELCRCETCNYLVYVIQVYISLKKNSQIMKNATATIDQIAQTHQKIFHLKGNKKNLKPLRHQLLLRKIKFCSDISDDDCNSDEKKTTLCISQSHISKVVESVILSKVQFEIISNSDNNHNYASNKNFFCIKDLNQSVIDTINKYLKFDEDYVSASHFFNNLKQPFFLYSNLAKTKKDEENRYHRSSQWCSLFLIFIVFMEIVLFPWLRNAFQITQVEGIARKNNFIRKPLWFSYIHHANRSFRKRLKRNKRFKTISKYPPMRVNILPKKESYRCIVNLSTRPNKLHYKKSPSDTKLLPTKNPDITANASLLKWKIALDRYNSCFEVYNHSFFGRIHPVIGGGIDDFKQIKSRISAWLNTIPNNSNLKKKHIYITKLDLKGCYDRIRHQKLQQILRDLPMTQITKCNDVEYCDDEDRKTTIGMHDHHASNCFVIWLPYRIHRLDSSNFFLYDEVRFDIPLPTSSSLKVFGLEDIKRNITKIGSITNKYRKIITSIPSSLYPNGVEYNCSLVLTPAWGGKGNSIKYAKNLNDLTEAFEDLKELQKLYVPGLLKGKSKIWQLSEGIVQGSKLSPLFNNIYLGAWENEYRRNYKCPNNHHYDKDFITKNTTDFELNENPTIFKPSNAVSSNLPSSNSSSNHDYWCDVCPGRDLYLRWVDDIILLSFSKEKSLCFLRDVQSQGMFHVPISPQKTQTNYFCDENTKCTQSNNIIWLNMSIPNEIKFSNGKWHLNLKSRCTIENIKEGSTQVVSSSENIIAEEKCSTKVTKEKCVVPSFVFDFIISKKSPSRDVLNLRVPKSCGNGVHLRKFRLKSRQLSTIQKKYNHHHLKPQNTNHPDAWKGFSLFQMGFSGRGFKYLDYISSQISQSAVMRTRLGTLLSNEIIEEPVIIHNAIDIFYEMAFKFITKIETLLETSKALGACKPSAKHIEINMIQMINDTTQKLQR